MTEKLKATSPRTYVRREGRTTTAQRRALDHLWADYGIDPGAGPVDLTAIFARSAPCVLEIGFGMGETLTTLAQAHPELNFLGADIYRPGIGHALLELQRLQLSNVRIANADIRELVEHALPAASLAAVLIFFPDPWPKKRHHKRRLVQTEFMHAIARVLAPGGRLHMATDWQDYAEHITTVMQLLPEFAPCSEPSQRTPFCIARPSTKFERRGLRLGHTISDLIYERTHYATVQASLRPFATTRQA